jgi:hypothetical protein
MTADDLGTLVVALRKATHFLPFAGALLTVPMRAEINGFLFEILKLDSDCTTHQVQAFCNLFGPEFTADRHSKNCGRLARTLKCRDSARMAMFGIACSGLSAHSEPICSLTKLPI